MIYNTCVSLFEKDDIKEELQKYLSSDLLNEIYFKPKKIDKSLIEEKINDDDYYHKVIQTINYYKNFNLEKVIKDKLHDFELDTTYKIENYNIYIIIGLDTTTIYSIRYNDEDITVLLLESTSGIMDNLNHLLAHEYTHFIRKQFFKRDIFEKSLGERLIVEEIGCSYSKEIVPNKDDSVYCIVEPETVLWVKNNHDKVKKHMEGKMHTNELMHDYFYMYADIKKTGLLPRTGYVYGYLIVQEYLKKHHLKIKDILVKDWKDFF